MSGLIRLNENDSVAVATRSFSAGSLLDENLAANQDVPMGHKIALRSIATGEPVRKYNQIIGFAASDIAPGDHIHVHNLNFDGFERDYAIGSEVSDTAFVDPASQATFQGFRRASGQVGTRNYIGVLTTVNCSATVARYISQSFDDKLLSDYPNVDGVVSLVHSTGCGMADNGEGFANLQRTLWGYARHPNLAGVILVGLGCEINQIDFLLEAYGLKEGPLFQTMNIQDTGGARQTVEHGISLIKAMLPEANKATREAVPASELTVALQCGGSDAFSGITANPALGAACDRLVSHGGTGILAETPEIYGAEHLLTRRAADPKVADKLLKRIAWWEEYTERNHDSMDNNPSPGNKRGGLTTILEKSLGAAAKGGTTNLTGVYHYAEQVDTKGFVFMDSPGYDPCSVTGQIASGANLVCFTTGRGSVFGAKPVPSIKLATNSDMYDRMSEDMDMNCGEILDGSKTVAQMGDELFEMFLDIASGKPSKSEAFGVGDLEFIPWQIGAVM